MWWNKKQKYTEKHSTVSRSEELATASLFLGLRRQREEIVLVSPGLGLVGAEESWEEKEMEELREQKGFLFLGENWPKPKPRV